MMQTLPIFLAIKKKQCLLVGDGEVAERKRRLLEKAGADIATVSDVAAQTTDWNHALHDVVLVVAASKNLLLNEQVSLVAQSHHILVNVVDHPALSTFIFPAIVERDTVTVAITSNGAAPVLTRLLRARIEMLLPPSLGVLAQHIGQFRQQVKSHLLDMRQRMRFWDVVLQRYLASDFDTKHRVTEAYLEAQLDTFLRDQSAQGLVSIVGSGTGDPDLLTIKALRSLQACDRVLRHPLVDEAIGVLARRDAEQKVIQSGENIANLLIDCAKRHEHVVWLVPGDPLSLRDMQALLMQLQAASVAFVIVPGVIDQVDRYFNEK